MKYEGNKKSNVITYEPKDTRSPLRDTVPHKTQGWGHTQKCQQKQLIDVTAKTIYN